MFIFPDPFALLAKFSHKYKQKKKSIGFEKYSYLFSTNFKINCIQNLLNN